MAEHVLSGVEKRLEFISGQVAEFVRNAPYRTVIPCNLDAAGNGTAILFECPELATLRLHRVIVQSLLHGPLNPYASVTGWLGLYRNDVQAGNLIDYVPAGQTMFPSAFTADTDEAEVLQPNSVLRLDVVGGPANDLVIARVQGVFHSDYRTQYQAKPLPQAVVQDEPRSSVQIAEPVT